MPSRLVHALWVRIFSLISQPMAKITSASGISVRTSQAGRSANKLKLNAHHAITPATDQKHVRLESVSPKDGADGRGVAALDPERQGNKAIRSCLNFAEIQRFKDGHVCGGQGVMVNQHLRLNRIH